MYFKLKKINRKVRLGFEARLLTTFLFWFGFGLIICARSWTQSLLHAKLMHIHWTLSPNISAGYRWTLASKLYLLPNTTFPISERCFLKNFTGDKYKHLLIKWTGNKLLLICLSIFFMHWVLIILKSLSSKLYYILLNEIYYIPIIMRLFEGV